MGQAAEGGGGGWTPIHFGMYNIQKGWNGGLELVIRVMGQANMDIGIFSKLN